MCTHVTRHQWCVGIQRRGNAMAGGVVVLTVMDVPWSVQWVVVVWDGVRVVEGHGLVGELGVGVMTVVGKGVAVVVL